MWKIYSLSLALLAAFVLCVAGHSWAGWKVCNELQREHEEREIGYAEFLRGSEFSETISRTGRASSAVSLLPHPRA